MKVACRMYSSRIKVYTRTGDSGTTALFNGQRRHKDDLIFEALGCGDELNAHVGVALSLCGSRHLRCSQMLSQVQYWLLEAGASVATPPVEQADAAAMEQRMKRVAWPAGLATTLEKWIDEMDEPLPPLKNFILPGGNPLAAQLHVGRTVCRRWERTLWALQLNQEKPYLDQDLLRFSNRLSDWFFVAARRACWDEGSEEIIYKKT